MPVAPALVAQPVLQPPPLATTFAPAAPAPTPRQQAAALPPPGASRLNGPVANGIHLQVGAFATKAEADRHLAQVQAQAAATLGSYPAQSIQAVSNGKTVFRARFTGVDPAAAGNICNDLRRRQIDCMVARAE